VACLDGTGTGITGHAAGELFSRVNRGGVRERKKRERDGSQPGLTGVFLKKYPRKLKNF